MLFVAGVRSPLSHAQFLDCLEYTKSTLHFRILLTVNVLVHSKYYVFNTVASDLGHTTDLTSYLAAQKFQTISPVSPRKPWAKPNGRLTEPAMGTRLLRWRLKAFPVTNVQCSHTPPSPAEWLTVRPVCPTPQPEFQGCLVCFKDLKATCFIILLHVLQPLASLLIFSLGYKLWETAGEVSHCLPELLSVAAARVRACETS